MQSITQVFATAGWTSFSGVFSTVFPLAIVLSVLVWYWAAARRHP
jgi:hypothetical protein